MVLAEGKRPSISQNTFSHSASIALGGRAGCEMLECRLKRIDELARFAVLYSDCVYIDNFFANYEHFRYKTEDELKIELTIDIHILTVLKPLLEKGFVKFYLPEAHACSNCFDAVFDRDTEKRIERGYKRLSNEYFTNSTVSLYRLDKHLCKFSFDGLEPYFDHGMILSVHARNRKLQGILKSRPRIVAKFKKDGPVALSQAVKKEIGLHRKFAGQVVDSAAYGIISAKILNTSYLTDNPLEISFLQSVSDDPQIDRRNSIALKHLTSIVPFVGDVTTSDLIKVRMREEEAFIKYRRALNEAIEGFKSLNSTFTEKDARALYSDVIAPQLATLDRCVSLAKRDLVKTASRSIIAVVGAISFGLYTGFIPSQFADMAKAVGFTKIVADILEKSIPIGKSIDDIKNEDLYFLWKTKRLRQ